MRRARRLLVPVLLLAFAAIVSGEIYLSHHDFSRRGWSQEQICLPCHTPHHADPSVIAAPLWNHEVTTAAYVTYSSHAMDATPGQPGGLSKLVNRCSWRNR